MPNSAPSLSLSWFPVGSNPAGSFPGMPGQNPWWSPNWTPANPSTASGWNYGTALQDPTAGIGYDPAAARVSLFPDNLSQGQLSPTAVPAAAMPQGSTGLPAGVPLPSVQASTPVPGAPLADPGVGLNPLASQSNMGVNLPQSISGDSKAVLQARANQLGAGIVRDNQQALQQWQLGIGAGLGLLNFGLGAYSLYKAGQQGDFQMGLARTNLANSIASYNTAQEDRVRGRYAAQDTQAGRDAVQAEIDKRKLKDSNL